MEISQVSVGTPVGFVRWVQDPHTRDVGLNLRYATPCVVTAIRCPVVVGKPVTARGVCSSRSELTKSGSSMKLVGRVGDVGPSSWPLAGGAHAQRAITVAIARMPL